MILNHLFISVHTNKIFEECAVFLNMSDAGVRSTFAFIGYLHGFCGVNYSILANSVSLFFSRLLLM